MRLLLAILITLPLFGQLPKNEAALTFGIFNADDGTGAKSKETAASVSYNRFWTPMVSTRLGLTEYGIGFSGFADVKAKTLTVEFHPLRHEILSPYFGAGAAYYDARVSTRYVSERANS